MEEGKVVIDTSEQESQDGLILQQLKDMDGN